VSLTVSTTTPSRLSVSYVAVKPVKPRRSANTFCRPMSVNMPVYSQ